MNLQIPSKLALVTGASSGIGTAACEFLADKGINLIISGRNNEQLDRLQKKLREKVSVLTVIADLSTSEGRSHLISLLHAKVPDLVINNAGFGLYGEALSHSTDAQVEILEVNARAVLELTLEAARALIASKKQGVILNVSSAAAFQILPSTSVYAASKAFVNQFSQAFDFEVKRYGVRILSFCPGRVLTDFQRRAGGRNDSLTTYGMMSADFVAKKMWEQIINLKPCYIIDWKYRLMNFISYFIPKNWIGSFNNFLITKIIKK